MTWTRNRVLALGGLSAGALALALAVFSALGAPDRGVSAAKAADATISSQTVAIGGAQVTIRVLPSGTCFTVTDSGGTAHACPQTTDADDIGFALTPNGVGGLAGPDIHAVIVRLTRKGTVWARLRNGAFYAAVPEGYRARRVVKVLQDGSRSGFAA